MPARLPTAQLPPTPLSLRQTLTFLVFLGDFLWILGVFLGPCWAKTERNPVKTTPNPHRFGTKPGIPANPPAFATHQQVHKGNSLPQCGIHLLEQAGCRLMCYYVGGLIKNHLSAGYK